MAKPIISFLQEIEKHEKTAKQIKGDDDDVFYISKEEVINAYKKREEYMKKILFTYFPEESYISVQLGFREED